MHSPYATLDDLTRELESRNLSRDALVQKSLLQAQCSHSHIQRHDGYPYLERHVYPVTISTIDHEELIGHEITPEIVSGALLHDVMEDDPHVNESYFLNEFGQKMFEIVFPLTKLNYRHFAGSTKHEKKTQLNEYYLNLLRESPYEAKIIKLADRDNNLQTVFAFSDRKRHYYILETEKFYVPFAQEVSPYFHRRLVNDINELRINN
jgi:(p)ppGpp synthase/HD superfamily hydrolase